MIQPDVLAAMISRRMAADDPSLVIVEAVLLRSAFERVDDFLAWLDQHTATTHGTDPSATAVCQMIGGIRHKIARELTHVDLALDRIEE